VKKKPFISLKPKKPNRTQIEKNLAKPGKTEPNRKKPSQAEKLSKTGKKTELNRRN
jgi:hypothetical protein